MSNFIHTKKYKAPINLDLIVYIECHISNNLDSSYIKFNMSKKEAITWYFNSRTENEECERVYNEIIKLHSQEI